MIRTLELLVLVRMPSLATKVFAVQQSDCHLVAIKVILRCEIIESIVPLIALTSSIRLDHGKL